LRSMAAKPPRRCEGGNQLRAPCRLAKRVQDEEEIEVKQTQTKAAPRFSEATLLGRWKGPASSSRTRNCAKPWSERGLGTPGDAGANHREPDCRGIRPPHQHRTAALRQGIHAAGGCCAGLSIEELSKPELTGEWSSSSRQMEHGGSRVRSS